MTTKTTTGLSALTLVLAASGWILAQTPTNPSLTPPTGTVAPVFKTLDQVEPRVPVNAQNTPGDTDAIFVISDPGSYYLTDDLLGVSGKNGITVEADNVTLDLNGFELRGIAGSFSGLFISAPVGTLYNSVTVHDGSISNWGDSGIFIAGSTTHLRGLHCHTNGSTGIVMAAGSAKDCSATGNTGNGISASSAVIEGCLTSSNTLNGIYAINGSHVRDCVSDNNTLFGISVGSFVVVTGCASNNNSGGGIQATASKIEDNLVAQNSNTAGTSIGIEVTGPNGNSQIVGNVIRSNDRSLIAGGKNSLIVKNLFFSNGGLSIGVDNLVGKLVNAARTTAPITTRSGGGLGAGGTAIEFPFANIFH